MSKSTSRQRKATVIATPAPVVQTTKLSQILTLLQRPTGASLPQLMEATGWQAHSVRGALSGHVRGKLKLDLLSEKVDGGRVYRIAESAQA